jgi:hypothetical protein
MKIKGEEIDTMKRKLLVVTLALLVGIVLTGAATAAEVSQGRVVSVTTDPSQVIMEEYDINFSAEAPYGNATGIITHFDLTRAKVGLKPEPGDILRIAYVIEGEKNVALKVMNVSKQDLRKK